MKRPWHDRLIDRAWCELCSRLDDDAPPPRADGRSDARGSVSGPMDWPLACAALADGTWRSAGFRRKRAVRQVVETLAPSDGRVFAKWIARTRPEMLDDTRIRQANDWGTPLQAPSVVLGTRGPWSPTSLRYLAHAIWLEDQGFIHRGGTMLELGVGFGGLAAMCALVSGASTVMVDLPDVERAAALQMAELGLARHVRGRGIPGGGFCFVSNYAFTELERGLQDRYIEDFVRHAARGVIASNAGMFSEGIGGRGHDELADRLRAAGLDPFILTEAPILGPSDKLCGNRLICWKPPGD